jgi:transposase
MAIIRQQRLFSWREVEDLQDLERLRLVIEHMPDEQLMRVLEEERGCGRDDHPVRGMWNSILAGVVYGHESIESLRRELGRNAQLRELCGLRKVPSAAAYTRFLKRLVSKRAELEAIFDRLVSELCGELEGFGEVLAIDSKALRSHGRPVEKG